jgi:hypothetical protein
MSNRGNARICSREKFLLVDNLSNGVDLYNIPRTSPHRSFEIPSTRTYVKGTCFAENNSLAVCGSDHGQVYTFCLGGGDRQQTLKHGSKKTMIQAIDVSKSSAYSRLFLIEFPVHHDHRLSYRCERLIKRRRKRHLYLGETSKRRSAI